MPLELMELVQNRNQSCEGCTYHRFPTTTGMGTPCYNYPRGPRRHSFPLPGVPVKVKRVLSSCNFQVLRLGLQPSGGLRPFPPVRQPSFRERETFPPSLV